MTYRYKEITPSIRRPIIEIIVKTESKFAIYPALIDSGADYCIFTTELATALEVKLQKKKTIFMGIGKDKVVGFWGKVEIKLGNKSYETRVIFAEINKFGHGVLGQQGFFDHFDVKLSYQKQTIEIDPLKISN